MGFLFQICVLDSFLKLFRFLLFLYCFKRVLCFKTLCFYLRLLVYIFLIYGLCLWIYKIF